MEGEIALVDLKSAYLQVRVAKELWQYQLVRYKGETYCLTRLGFGLSSAPRIMASILKYVLAKSITIQVSTKSYVDDILVKTSQVPAETLIAHLNQFGLVNKPPEQLDGGTALGLKVLRNGRGSWHSPGVMRCHQCRKTDPEGVVFNLWKIGGSLPRGWVVVCGVKLCEAEGRGRQVG